MPEKLSLISHTPFKELLDSNAVAFFEQAEKIETNEEQSAMAQTIFIFLFALTTENDRPLFQVFIFFEKTFARSSGRCRELAQG